MSKRLRVVPTMGLERGSTREEESKCQGRKQERRNTGGVAAAPFHFFLRNRSPEVQMEPRWLPSPPSASRGLCGMGDPF